MAENGNPPAIRAGHKLVGKEYVPAEIPRKPFAQLSIEGLATADANTYTAVLTVVPTVIVFGIGLVIIVRRKYA